MTTQQLDPVRIKAHQAQLDFIACRDAPYVGFVGGRGAGKSTACAMRLWKWSMLEKGLYGCYAPTYPLLNDTILRVFLNLAKPHITEYNQGRNVIRMYSGSEIICRSLDDFERARGPSLRGAVWDEASLCPQAAFDILIGGLRFEGQQGWLACGFTPKGVNHWTASIFNDPQRPDSKCFHATTMSNPFNPPNFADTLRKQYTKSFAQQEIDGGFVSLGGSLMRREWFRIVNEIPPQHSVMRYWDLASTPVDGSNDPDWTAGAKVGRTKDGRWIILDMRHARLSPGGNELLIQQTAGLDGHAVGIGMEEEGGASGKSLVDHYRRAVLMGYNFNGYRPTGDKVVRAMPLAAAAEAGNVLLLTGEWNKTFLDEVESFGPDCPHDDQVDAVSGAVNCLAPRFIKPNVGFGQTAEERISDLDRQIREALYELPVEERRELEAQLV